MSLKFSAFPLFALLITNAATLITSGVTSSDVTAAPSPAPTAFESGIHPARIPTTIFPVLLAEPTAEASKIIHIHPGEPTPWLLFTYKPRITELPTRAVIVPPTS